MLGGIRILDLSEEPGFLAGKILGDLGADVVKLEPPGGDRFGRRGPYLGEIADPERSLRWLALNTSKRGITLALGDAARARAVPPPRRARRRRCSRRPRPGRSKRSALGWETLRAERPRSDLVLAHALRPHGTLGAASARTTSCSSRWAGMPR